MKITERIHLLKIDFNIAISPGKTIPRFVNVILIFEDDITLIDTGVKGSEEKIFEYLSENKRDFKEISNIILSHSHPDHIGSAARIKELTNCKVLAHELEKEWIEHIDIQNGQRPVPGFYNLVDKSVTIDNFITDISILNAAKDLTLQFIHSPGHSKGSINILFKEDGILFTADSIPLKNDIPNYDNFADLMRSLDIIKKNKLYNLLLSSWTSPLNNKDQIKNLIKEGEEYMIHIDKCVKTSYKGEEQKPLDFCRITIEKLGLPPFLINPLVDKAFRSHL